MASGGKFDDSRMMSVIIAPFPCASMCNAVVHAAEWILVEHGQIDAMHLLSRRALMDQHEVKGVAYFGWFCYSSAPVAKRKRTTRKRGGAAQSVVINHNALMVTGNAKALRAAKVL